MWKAKTKYRTHRDTTQRAYKTNYREHVENPQQPYVLKINIEDI